MSGHSHWASIKHKKGAVDAKKGAVFSKLAKAIMLAARGGPDPAFNSRLRTAVDAARAVSMPGDKITNAIKKGSGQLEGQVLEETTYEAYGAGGVALYMTAITDNRNRTTPEIKKILSLKGGTLGTPNSVAWQFKRKGFITVPAAGITEDKLMEVAIEAGAEDLARLEDNFEITTAPEAFDAVKKAVEASGAKIAASSLAMAAENYVDVTDEVARKNLSLIEELEDNEDIQTVTANFNIPKSVLSELQKA
jgi:YebC/PmpR family DNA-binding regulatory protein